MKKIVGGSAGAHYRNHAGDGTVCERVLNIYFLYFFAAGRAGMGGGAPLDEAAFLKALEASTRLGGVLRWPTWQIKARWVVARWFRLTGRRECSAPLWVWTGNFI